MAPAVAVNSFYGNSFADITEELSGKLLRANAGVWAEKCGRSLIFSN